jgi:predicted AlkP superfamily pyrophosphatase or phosphodiesterase
MANFETEITLDVLDLVYSLPKQKQIKLVKEILSNLDSNELNKLIPQNNTDNDRINFLNKELNSNYKSLYEVDWVSISKDKILSESFIREFQDDVDWYWISYKQKLSENFIREFADKVDWRWISVQQTLSEDFKREFQDKIKK